MRAKIRPMTPRDKPAIIEILKTAPEFKPSEVIIAEEIIDSYLEQPHQSGYYVLVAEVETVVVGYVCYGPTPLTEGTWDIYWLAVAGKKQSRGIGGALMAFAEDEIKKARSRMVIVETSSQAGYEKTRRFYHRYGYEVVARIPHFYAPGDDKIVLQKQLILRK